MNQPSDRLAEIRGRMEAARRRFGPPPEAVELIAVSKTVPAAELQPYLIAGLRVFGENRVQEAKAKWPALRDLYPDLRLHLIGPLQTNKVRDAIALFDCIQSVDRDRLAGALGGEMEKAAKQLPVFVQVNIGGEPQKAGIPPGETVDFVRRCRNEHGLTVEGLMCIPPDGEPAGPYFAHLASLGRAAGTERLSMGMSGDFETAIAMGATDVRIGSALFGPRTGPV